ncbi:MAG: glycosyltransferase, partial [Longimicrobiaceae bacterium]
MAAPASAGPGRPPRLSVVVAVHDGEAVLPRSLAALAASGLPRAEWELVVVDDASADQGVLRAAEHADVVVRLPGRPRGPAYARPR